MSDEPDEDLLKEYDDDIVWPRRSSSHAHSGVGKKWVAAAGVVGIIIGVWMAGKPGADSAAPTSAHGPSAVSAPAPGSSATPDRGSSAAPDPARGSSVRKAELIAWLTDHPSDTDAHLELGVIAFNDGDVESARAEWTLVTQLDPSSARAWYNLGFYYLSLDPPDEVSAQQAWTTVIGLDPESDLARSVQTHIGGLMDAPGSQPAQDEDPANEEMGR